MTATATIVHMPELAASDTVTLRSEAVPVPVRERADEVSALQRIKIVEASGTLDFWDDPKEDVYTHDDGHPV